MPRIVPALWMPRCAMQRIVAHWTAGGYRPSSEDSAHYHLMIDGEGQIHRGKFSIADNLSTKGGEYAAHTLGANTGAIGIAVCAMDGAWRFPPRNGPCPIRQGQWNNLLLAIADLCEFYRLPITPTRLLMHCEVQKTLGIRQHGKWDISRRTWPAGEWKGLPPGVEMRDRVQRLLRG